MSPNASVGHVRCGQARLHNSDLDDDSHSAYLMTLTAHMLRLVENLFLAMSMIIYDGSSLLPAPAVPHLYHECVHDLSNAHARSQHRSALGSFADRGGVPPHRCHGHEHLAVS